MIQKIASIVFAMVFFSMSACKTDFDDVNYYDGDADFTSLVVIGGSHMAGYMDRALYLEAQSNSIPAIMATRLSFIGGKQMIQPIVYPGVGIGISGNSKFVLQQVTDPCLAGNLLVAQPITATGDASNYAWLGDQITYNNLAVPNTRIADVTRQSFGYPNPAVGNLLYARFASEPGTSTILGDALLQNPTFVMVWLGMEDVYNYARSGGEEGHDSITSYSEFSSYYNDLVNQLTSLNAGGILLNIPYPSSIPFFTSIPYNGLQLTAAEASDLNLLYSGVDSTISFTAGNNPFVIADTEEPTGRRFIKPGEYILLSVSRDSINCQDWGRIVPIPENYILDEDEVNDIVAAINYFNGVIASAAASENLALADMNAYFNTLKSGILFNNFNFSAQYLDGGAFSTDGYHPSQRGGALITNEIITSVNRFYNAKIPMADVNAYTGIIFP